VLIEIVYLRSADLLILVEFDVQAEFSSFSLKKMGLKNIFFPKSKQPVINTAEAITTNNVALNVLNMNSQQNRRSVETQTRIRNLNNIAKFASNKIPIKCTNSGNEIEPAPKMHSQKDNELKKDESFFFKFYDCPTYQSANF
jgi:hypothetical protein